MRVRRQQIVSIGDLQNSVDVLTSTVAAMQANAAMYSGAQDIISGIATNTITRTTDIVESQAGIVGRLDGLETNYNTMTATVDAAGVMMNTMAASMAQSSVVAAAAVDARVDEAMVQMSTVLAANNARAQAQMAGMTAASNSQMAVMTASVAASVSTVTGSLTAMNSTIFAAIATRADAKKHVWVGGCSACKDVDTRLTRTPHL